MQREEVHIEREPITDANVSAAMSGPDISEEEHEVTLASHLGLPAFVRSYALPSLYDRS